MIRPVLAIAGREAGAMFRTPAGWVVTALFSLLTAAVFTVQTLVPGEPATMRPFFSPAAWLLIVVAPAVSMRLFSEEFRSGTIEPLLTAPASPLAVVLGKYAGAVFFLACMLLPTLVYPAVLMWAADGPIDAGAIASGYLGLLLVSMLYVSVGMLVSTMTDSQVLAFLVTLIVLLLTMIAAGPVAQRAPARLAPVLAQLSVPGRAADFARGLIETRHVAALLAASGFMLAGAWVSLARRRGGGRPVGRSLRVGVFLAASAVIAVSVGVIGANTNARFDTTATRAHALGPRTLARLRTLDHPVELVIAVDRSGIDPRARDRVDDVLDAFDHASEMLSVTFIDTGSTRGRSMYDDLLARLEQRDAPAARRIETRAEEIITRARQMLERLGSLDAAAAAVDDPSGRCGRYAAWARVASRQLGETLGDGTGPAAVIETARAVSDFAERLTPQLEAAAEEIRETPDPAGAENAGPLRRVARVIESLRGEAALIAELGRSMGMTDMQRVADALGSGAAALLIGPPRDDGGPGVVAIDLDELYPPGELFDLDASAARAATADRAEQLIASALAVLTDPARPIVVFVHGESRRWVGKAGVMSGLLDRMQRAGVGSAEWAAVLEENPPRLDTIDPSGDRPVVYFIISPDSSAAARPDDPESRTGTARATRLGEVVASLVSGGAPVLVNLAPSVFPTFGDDDPIAAALEPLGITAASGTPVLSAAPGGVGGVGRAGVSTVQRFTPPPSDDPIGSAIAGLPVALEWPVPLELAGDAEPLLMLDASPDRWAESQWLSLWRTPRNQRRLLADQPRFDGGDSRGPWVVAARARGATGADGGAGRSRVVVVGSNTWMLDHVWRAQRVVNNRPVLVNPGNPELFDAAVLWLAGRDELIAPSPSARPVALVRPLPGSTIAAVRWLLIGGLPGLILLAGVVHRVVRG